MRRYRGFQAFFAFGFIAYGIFLGVLFAAYAPWRGIGIGTTGPDAPQNIIKNALVFVPFLYFSMSLFACRQTLSGTQLRMAIVASLAFLAVTVAGFALATPTSEFNPRLGIVIGTTIVWSPCIIASSWLTLLRWHPA